MCYDATCHLWSVNKATRSSHLAPGSWRKATAAAGYESEWAQDTTPVKTIFLVSDPQPLLFHIGSASIYGNSTARNNEAEEQRVGM